MVGKAVSGDGEYVLETLVVEWRVLRRDIRRQGASTESYGTLFHPLQRVMGNAGQTKQGELGNNLLAGTVGGFVGTTLNTPCTFVQTEKKTKLISAVDVVKSRVQLKGTGEWYAPFLCLGQS